MIMGILYKYDIVAVYANITPEMVSLIFNLHDSPGALYWGWIADEMVLGFLL